MSDVPAALAIAVMKVDLLSAVLGSTAGNPNSLLHHSRSRREMMSGAGLLVGLVKIVGVGEVEGLFDNDDDDDDDGTPSGVEGGAIAWMPIKEDGF